MGYLVEYLHLSEYDVGQPGISLPITLSLATISVTTNAKLDTGSTDCIFARQYGEQLGLIIEDGCLVRIGTATGIFTTYRHPVTLAVLGHCFDVGVCFAADESFQRNVLGRHGFLEQLVLGLVDYEGKLYLRAYNE
ncbi:MAG: hypothetical protein HY774_21890 [Acidobacteria bacterium]|nr:hypothetical protein [Acidobacteriota bacterium]